LAFSFSCVDFRHTLYPSASQLLRLCNYLLLSFLHWDIQLEDLFATIFAYFVVKIVHKYYKIFKTYKISVYSSYVLYMLYFTSTSEHLLRNNITNKPICRRGSWCKTGLLTCPTCRHGSTPCSNYPMSFNLTKSLHWKKGSLITCTGITSPKYSCYVEESKTIWILRKTCGDTTFYWSKMMGEDYYK
jgi:hypothetical protein